MACQHGHYRWPSTPDAAGLRGGRRTAVGERAAAAALFLLRGATGLLSKPSAAAAAAVAFMKLYTSAVVATERWPTMARTTSKLPGCRVKHLAQPRWSASGTVVQPKSTRRPKGLVQDDSGLRCRITRV